MLLRCLFPYVIKSEQTALQEYYIYYVQLYNKIKELEGTKRTLFSTYNFKTKCTEVYYQQCNEEL